MKRSTSLAVLALEAGLFFWGCAGRFDGDGRPGTILGSRPIHGGADLVTTTRTHAALAEPSMPATLAVGSPPGLLAGVPEESATPLPGDPFAQPNYPAAWGAPSLRVGSLVWGTWIQGRADSRALPLGSLRPGQSLARLDASIIPGRGDCRTFVRVQGGLVCAHGRGTLDMESPFIRAGRWTAPVAGAFPFHYALSLGAPMLTRPKRPADPEFSVGSRELSRLKGWAAGHDELAVDDMIQANGDAPEFLAGGGQVPTPWGPSQGPFVKKIPRGSMLAYTRAFEAEGEVWVLSTNLTVVPARGLKAFKRSSFHGVELTPEVSLPLAWIRKRPRSQWRVTEAGEVEAGGVWPVRSWVALSGTRKNAGGRLLLGTRDPEVFLDGQDATVVEGVTVRPKEVVGDQKWIHVRVEQGTLTLYQGLRPVFTTLMSPGKEGATPYGRYFIESKHHTTTMTTEDGDPKKFWIADVPWTLYFKRPYAIHGAFWHEDFGEKKSGGCVNLSPLDAKRVFDWAEPALPEGWESVQGGRASTFVLIEQ